MPTPTENRKPEAMLCPLSQKIPSRSDSSQRRPVLAGILATILCAWQGINWVPAYAQIGRKKDKVETDPTRLPPQPGDRFTYFYGDRKGQIIKPDDVPVASKQILVYPIEPQTGTIRDGSRLNLVLLIRFAPEQLDERTLANASEGVVAYSAICTHQGCPVTNWHSGHQTLFCPCHNSEYDPTSAAKIVGGPTPRRLPTLPLSVEEGVLVVAGAFTGRVGGQKK